MDGSFTDYANNLVLNAIYGGSGFTPPTTLYIGLSTSLLQKTSVGTSPVEPNDLYYTRVAVTNNYNNFPPASAGQKSSTPTITWPVPRKDWGVIKSVFVADASGIRGGNVWDFYNLTNPMTINSGDPAVYIASGTFQKIFT